MGLVTIQIFITDCVISLSGTSKFRIYLQNTGYVHHLDLQGYLRPARTTLMAYSYNPDQMVALISSPLSRSSPLPPPLLSFFFVPFRPGERGRHLSGRTGIPKDMPSVHSWRWPMENEPRVVGLRWLQCLRIVHYDIALQESAVGQESEQDMAELWNGR